MGKKALHKSPAEPAVPLLTVSEVAEALGLSISSIRRAIADRALQVHRFGRTLRVSQEDLAAFRAKSREKAL